MVCVAMAALSAHARRLPNSTPPQVEQDQLEKEAHELRDSLEQELQKIRDHLIAATSIAAPVVQGTTPAATLNRRIRPPYFDIFNFTPTTMLA
jgi:hypothetical protein